MRPSAPLLVALALLAPALAGCLDRSGPDAGDDLAPGAGGRGGAGGGGGGGGGGATPGGNDSAAGGWPALDAAKVRPGVQVRSDGGQCTSNFVFASPDNASLYLGLAAHCVEGMELGEAVDVGGVASGTLAYSSWLTMGRGSGGSVSTGDESCEEEADATACSENDFALIRIDDKDRALVHPAMRHFGGPTALVDSSGVGSGDKVLTYGNSGLRGQVDPLSWHEGYVVERASDWTTLVYTVTPGLPGDSGSGVLSGDGRALGVLVTLSITPLTGSNGVTHLDRALAYAAEKAGVEARLVTWELLDPGLLPGA